MRYEIMGVAFAPIVLLLVIGAARLLAALLEHREARTRAARRAAELVAWGQTEAAVITAESQWAHLRDADGFLDVAALSPADDAAFYSDYEREAAHG
jgi:cyanate permease